MVLRRWGPYIGGIVFAIYLISTLMNWFGSGSSEGKIITLKPNGCQVSPRAPLRIMAIGDSITEGSGSSDHNGYRMVLYEHLKTDCGSRKIEFVGSQQAGTPPVTDHEGYSGYGVESVINLSAENISATLAKKPNVILLHIGIENMSPFRSPETVSPENAPAKLDELVEYIFSIAPDVVLVVAQILWSPNQVWFENIPVYNAAIARMVKRKAERGRKISTVDMTSIGEHGCIRNIDGTWQECADLNDDGIHPKDEGYRKMAGFWYEGLVRATDNGWFKSSSWSG